MVGTRRSGTDVRIAELVALAVAVAFVVPGDRPLVDAVVVVGIGIVAPLALGPSRWWTVAAVAAAVGLRIEDPVAASVAVFPALLVAARTLGDEALAVWHSRRSIPSGSRRPSLDEVARLLAPTWASVAMISLLASTAEIDLFGIGEPIVRLTAVHYLYAGLGALVIARRLHVEEGVARHLATIALVATAVAPPIVATGFVLHEALPQIGGAVVMTVGVWSSAAVLLIRSLRDDPTPNLLRLVAGLTPWVPMVLAVSWAAAQHVADVPALSIPDMARLHGLANGVGFVLVGLLGTMPSAPSARVSVVKARA